MVFFRIGFIVAMWLGVPRWSLADTYDMGDITVDEAEIYETVVVETRPPLAAGTVIIAPDAIEKAAPDSADEMLMLIPGVKVVQHGAEGKGHQIFMRGFDAAHGSDVEARMGHVALNERSHVHGQGYLDLYGIIPEVVSTMTVAKGPYLPWQGDFAMAGSIRFDFGVDNARRPGFFSTDITHYGRIHQLAVLAPTSHSEETFAALSLRYDHGFGPDRQAYGGTLLTQYRHDMNRRHSIVSMLSLQSARFESPETLRLEDVEEKKKGFRGSYGPAGYGLSDRLLFMPVYRYTGETSELCLSLFGMLRDFRLDENFTGYLLYPEHGDLKRQSHQGGAAGVEANGQIRLRAAIPLVLKGGLGWRVDGFEQFEQQLEEGGDPFFENRRLRGINQELYAYSGVRLVLFEVLTLFPSLRAAAIRISAHSATGSDENQTKAAILPRAALRFSPHSMVSLFSSYGRGYRSPEARALLSVPTAEIEDERLSLYTGGSPEITLIDSVELGISVEFKELFVFHLTGFASWLENEMVFDHVSNLNVAMDGTRRFGTTAELRLRPVSWLVLDGDVTFTDARFNHSKNRVPGVPIWMGQVRVGIGETRGPSGAVSALITGKRPLAHGASVGGEFNLQVEAGWRFENVALRALIENATNQQLMEGAYHFASHFDPSEQRSALPAIHYAAGPPITFRFIASIYL